MSRYRKGAGGKRDDNEPDIIKALRAHGCVVWQLSGKGIPDLLVLRKGKKWLADVKMPGKPTTKPQEDAWEEAATKASVSVFILRTPEDATKMLNGALGPWEPSRFAWTHRALASIPKKGDADMARAEGRKRLEDPEQWEVALPDGRRLRNKPRSGAKAGRADYVEAYTPPLSTPVDAATEAEVFAPPPTVVCSYPACAARPFSKGRCGLHPTD
jgi:hypothetical protein